MTNFIDILAREATNTAHLYLYPEADGWCAYEQSACRLAQLLDSREVQKVINRTYEVSVVRVVLPDCFSFPHGLTLREAGYLEASLPRQPETLCYLWKEAQLKQTRQVVASERI